MIPKCIVCGTDMLLDDMDIYYNYVESYWYCPCCDWHLQMGYDKRTRQRKIISFTEELNFPAN